MKSSQLSIQANGVVGLGDNLRKRTYHLAIKVDMAHELSRWVKDVGLVALLRPGSMMLNVIVL